ncbi:MAG: hypothetical protein K8S56_00635, partial [Candidatus Cloacimonetes bacterium]|nr:hypothetical protein [Candidatus Cloacimonadota bacterium]
LKPFGMVPIGFVMQFDEKPELELEKFYQVTGTLHLNSEYKKGAEEQIPLDKEGKKIPVAFLQVEHIKKIPDLQNDLIEKWTKFPPYNPMYIE